MMKLTKIARENITDLRHIIKNMIMDGIEEWELYSNSPTFIISRPMLKDGVTVLAATPLIHIVGIKLKSNVPGALMTFSCSGGKGKVNLVHIELMLSIALLALS